MTVQKLVKFAPYVAGAALAFGIARADVGGLFVSSDYDAEFARAADLLEAGRARGGESASSRKCARGPRSGPGTLASTFSSRSMTSGAGISTRPPRRFAASSGAAIGLESYRRDRLARDLAAAGRTEEALREYHALERSEEPYAGRARTALDFARLLERNGAGASAAGVLARAAAASPSSSLELAPDRLRLALRAGDAASVRSLSRQLLLEAPLSDRSEAIPAEVRRALRKEEESLSAADRARRGRALIAAGDARRGVAMLSRDAPGRWPDEERSVNLLALSRGEAQLKRPAAALAAAARIPSDGSPASFEARLVRAQIEYRKLLARRRSPGAADARIAALTTTLSALTAPEAPAAVRADARERLIRLAFETEQFEAGLEQARALVAESPGTRSGFEPLWKLAWALYLACDWPGARARLDALAALYTPVDLQRRLSYWKARCHEREGDRAAASALYRDLSRGDPPDLYAQLRAPSGATGDGPRRDPLCPTLRRPRPPSVGSTSC